jgi:hypothetical protein
MAHYGTAAQLAYGSVCTADVCSNQSHEMRTIRVSSRDIFAQLHSTHEPWESLHAANALLCQGHRICIQ